MQQQLEQRDVSLFADDQATELRYTEGTAEQPHRFVGTIPYGTLSHDLGGLKERIMPTAFCTSLSNGADIRALADHDSTKLLGRTSNGTLRVVHTDKGLGVEIDMPDTSWARDVRELVRRKDVRGLSFGFVVRKNGHKFTKEGGMTVRELHDVDLREVSIVSQPAYPDTSVALRSAELALQGSSGVERPNASRCGTQLRRLLVQA